MSNSSLYFCTTYTLTSILNSDLGTPTQITPNIKASTLSDINTVKSASQTQQEEEIKGSHTGTSEESCILSVGKMK